MDTINASPKSSSITSTILSTVLAVGAVAWVVSAGIGLASAQTALPAPQPAAEKVSYADLDLRTESGAHVLLQRLDAAAQRLCGPEPVNSPLTPRQTALYERCVDEAVHAAVHSTGEPLVLVLNGQPLSGGASLAAR